jgi:hypothetical protein
VFSETILLLIIKKEARSKETSELERITRMNKILSNLRKHLEQIFRKLQEPVKGVMQVLRA